MTEKTESVVDAIRLLEEFERDEDFEKFLEEAVVALETFKNIPVKNTVIPPDNPWAASTPWPCMCCEPIGKTCLCCEPCMEPTEEDRMLGNASRIQQIKKKIKTRLTRFIPFNRKTVFQSNTDST